MKQRIIVTGDVPCLTARLLERIRPMPRPARPTRRAKPFNTIQIALETQRDVILENDPVYAAGMAQLAVQKRSGAVNGNARGIHEWLIAAALRRAHVPKGLAKAMLAA